MNRKYDTVFKESNIKLRYYQEEAVNMALIKEVGILALGCSAGKTIIAADLIKNLIRKLYS
jgi:superfamily II DNA or RNA helicase